MDQHIKAILGKRGRRMTGSERSEADQGAAPRRSRARTMPSSDSNSDVAASKSLIAKPRSGLLTPEPSSLNESPVSPASEVQLPLGTFPFMNLPAELRLRIYHMALVRYEPLILHAERAPTPTDEESTTPPSNSDTSQTPLPPTWDLHNTMPGNYMPFPSPTRWRTERVPPSESLVDRPRPSDPVVPVMLRLNKQIYKEARQLLYSENVFRLSLSSGIHTLSTLHQRSRSLIKHVVLTIPSHHDILDGFADLVRLGLRYCWGLKSFKIILEASLPDDTRANGATSVYANAFHILRWLPRGCSVLLEGCVSETVRRVVVEEGRLMNVLDETSYLKRQHQMPERH